MAQRDHGSIPAGVVTLLLTDIEGSTRLWEQDEQIAATIVSRHYDLIDEVVVAHRGARPVEQGEGDSVVAAFTDAVEAVAAAAEIQRIFDREAWPGNRTVRVRIALHTGSARLRDEANYAGQTIIRCARLRGVAHGGQTLLSDATRDAIGERLPDGVSLRGLGVHRLKDLGRPERVWQLCHPELVNEFPTLRSLDAMPNNLPAQMTSLVGRESELAALSAVLGANRVVTLTGAGGVGKSRLAAHAAADGVERHVDGSWWVDLGPVTDLELVAPSVAATFSLRAEQGRSLTDTLAEQLRSREALIVLDNCEQVLDAVSHLVETLVGAAPGLRFLATSREPLGVAGEAVWRVPSLDHASAVRLFVERAAQVRPGFDPDEDALEVIGEISDRLDGVPLAIELAAARARMMHPTRIASALDDRFRLLTGGRRNALSRQQTLEASVAWSHDLLDDRERLALRRLSVFSGGFTLDAAEAVCADGQLVEAYDVLGLVTQLVDKSLVQADGDIDGRYRLLETVRQYAQARLVESTESGEVRDRHLDYFLALAERGAAQFAGVDGGQWLGRIEQDHDNVRAAFEWADTEGRSPECLRLVTAMAIFWELRGHLAQGGRWFSRALSHDTPPDPVRARALWAAAHVALYSDDIPTALQRAPEALALAESVGDERAAVRATNTIGFGQLWFDPPGARALLSANIDRARACGEDWAVGDGLKMITISWMIQDDWSAGRAALDQLRRHAEPIGNQFFLAWCHYGLGYGALHQGDVATARIELAAAAALCEEIGDPATGGLTVAALGELDVVTGCPDAARARLEEFVRRARAAGGDWGEPFARFTLASVHLGAGDVSAALALTEELVANPDNVLPVLVSWSLSLHGAALLAAGDVAAATEVLADARVAAESVANPMLVALSDHLMACVALEHAEQRQAEDLFHRALAARHAAGLVPGVLESLEALAGLAADQASYPEALRLLAATVHHRESQQLAESAVGAQAREHVLALAAAALDDSTYDAATSEGTALTLPEAVAYATRARGERKRPSSGWEALTPTELDVVRFTVQGLTNPQIGEKLFISRATVKTHLAHVFTKLGIATRTELAALATRRGIA